MDNSINKRRDFKETMDSLKMELNSDNEDEDAENAAREMWDPATAFTGFFRDGRKRIDVVLVYQDDSDPAAEKVVINFLLSALKAGLMLELEYGVMEIHRNLIFIKIHAPNKILEEYGDYYNLKRYFKDSHVEFVKPSLFHRIVTFTILYNEREWIKLVRQQYVPSQYSTSERSVIVLKMLQQLPFGSHKNNFGLNRLTEKNIILDVYALHDGPYFFVPKQDLEKVNARQILFHQWTGKHNWCKMQPLNLVHEYLGDRVGFYFAFFGFYNQALFVAAIAGIVVACLEVFDTTDDTINNEVCNDNNTVICPTCRRFDLCPFRKLKDYCMIVKIINVLDNPFTYYYSLFVAIWATMFIGFWERKEHYWIWMWELNPNELKNTLRPEFIISSKNIKRSPVTGILKNFEGPRKRFMRYTLTSVLLLCAVLCVLVIIATLGIFRYWFMVVFGSTFSEAWGDYLILGMFGLINVIVLVTLEAACKKFSYKLTDFENHRTQDTYESSVVVKLYGFTFAFTFSVFIFFAYIKGMFYTYPSDPSRWYPLWGFGMTCCGPLGCLDEVWIMLMVTIFAKHIFMRASGYIFTMRTDYNQGNQINSQVPCWEREYQLKEIDEKFMTEKFKELVTQFGLVTLFVAAFPLAPLLALIVNIWDIRYNARLFLLGSRRPLLSKASGLGAWREIIVLLAYATAITNALTLALTTKTVQRQIYLKEHDNMEGFLKSTLSKFDVTDYLKEVGPGSPFEAYTKYKGFKPQKFCLYQGYRKPPEMPDRYKYTRNYWRVKFYEAFFIIYFEHLIVFMVLIFQYVIPSKPRVIQETMAMEERLKNIYIRNKGLEQRQKPRAAMLPNM